jgi:hypothetical protein
MHLHWKNIFFPKVVERKKLLIIIPFFLGNGICGNITKKILWHTPKLLDGLNCKSKGEQQKEKSWGTFLGSQHFGVEGHVRALGWDYED